MIYQREDDSVPSVCPVTGRKYFCALTHPDDGEMATYGGPFDSYSIPKAYPDDEFPEAKQFRCWHFDHDEGQWEDGTVGLDLFLVGRDTMLEVYDLREQRDELVKACRKVVGWLDRLAQQADEEAKNTRFHSVKDACKHDARNYRATASDVRKAIAKATGGAL